MAIKVLIVDDADFMRNLIKEVFLQDSAEGKFEVVGEASNGIEAVNLFEELKPDLITMDIVMPIKGGIEATREIMAKKTATKVVMCSALGQEPLVMEALEAGAADFIVKPFQAPDVLQVIENVMAQS